MANSILTLISNRSHSLQRKAILLSLFTVFSLYFFTDYNIYSILGLGTTLFLVLRLIIVADYTIPIIEIMLIIAAFQWIIGPLIDYQVMVTHHKMHMYIDKEAYMKITVPLFLVFTFSSLKLSKFIIPDFEKIKAILERNPNLPIYIIGISFLFRVANPFLPLGLAFFSYLAINSAITGLGLLYFSNASKTKKRIITLVVISPELWHSINTGMFHTAIISTLFVLIFINLEKKFSLLSKAIFLICSIAILSSLQFVKRDYRNIIHESNYTGDKLDLFLGLMFQSKNVEELREDENLNDVNTRLNQGWIISKIYSRIPSEEDYMDGETVIAAIEATLVPRILFPDKKVSGGGRETFEKLTGFKLKRNTAMGVSLLGEFYGNFGFYGAMLAFLIWGRILNFIVSTSTDTSKRSVIMLFWLPLIFFQVIKAESDLTSVLNHLVKSLVFVGLYMLFLRRILKINV